MPRHGEVGFTFLPPLTDGCRCFQKAQEKVLWALNSMDTWMIWGPFGVKVCLLIDLSSTDLRRLESEVLEF